MAGPFDLNLRHLRALEAIAEHGNISGAARAAGLSQPALTQGLAKLEVQFGAALFERHPQGMQPTATGKRILARIGRAMDRFARAVRAVEALGDEPVEIPTRLAIPLPRQCDLRRGR